MTGFQVNGTTRTDLRNPMNGSPDGSIGKQSPLPSNNEFVPALMYSGDSIPIECSLLFGLEGDAQLVSTPAELAKWTEFARPLSQLPAIYAETASRTKSDHTPTH
jgi:hypothetical protein